MVQKSPLPLPLSERNYSQIEKEVLSIVFGVKKFHSYFYGRKFTLIMDHQPLVSIFGPKTGVPPLSAAQMQRWSLILAPYQYEIEYRKSAEHANADALSRLVSTSADDRLDVDEYLISYVNELHATAQDKPVCNKERSSFSSHVQFHITWMAFSSCRSRVTAIFFTQA